MSTENYAVDREGRHDDEDETERTFPLEGEDEAVAMILANADTELDEEDIRHDIRRFDGIA